MSETESARDRSEVVRRWALEAGFSRCGFCAAGPIGHEAYLREWLAGGRAGTMKFMQRHVESRADVRSWLEWAKSVVVVALDYGQKRPERPDDGAARGRVAMYAWGADYHSVVKEKLTVIAERIRGRWGAGVRTHVCVDTSAIVEREVAAAAGIGWIGKNTMVLNERAGSYFVLGELVSEVEFAADSPATDHCGSCTRCLEACPTEAFPAAYEMDARRCISYLTIEHRGEIEGELAGKIGEWAFGCDVCQEACPFNRDAPETREPRLVVKSPEAAWPRLAEIEGWDRGAYLAATRGKATGRVSLRMWKRNAGLARAGAGK